MKLEVWFTKFVHPTYPEVRMTLELDQHKIALLMIDMQNTFLHPNGSLSVRGLDVVAARKIIAPTVLLADASRKQGIRVVYAQRTYRPDFSDRTAISFEMGYSRNLDTAAIQGNELVEANLMKNGLVRNTWGSAIIDELTPQLGDIVVDSKHLCSCFYQTDMELVLQSLGINTIIVAGVTTAVCVESSIREAYHRGFRCILIDDCTWEKTPEMEKASKTIISMTFGYMTSSQACLNALTV